MDAEVLITEKMPVDKIRHDGGTQSRVSVNSQTLADYTEQIEAGVTFPPVIVFFDGTDHWLADGFHRYLATRSAGEKWITAEVRAGSLADAIAHAAGSNSEHGLPRTTDDKRKCVRMLLECPEHQQKPTDWIKRQARVSESFVRKVIAEMSEEAGKPLRTTVVTKDGVERPAHSEQPPRSATTPARESYPDPPQFDQIGRLIPDKYLKCRETAQTIHGYRLAVGKLSGEIKRLQGTEGAERVAFAEIERELVKAREFLRDAQYHTECPTCCDTPKPAPKCNHCSGRGWITASGYRRLSDAERKSLAVHVAL